MMTNIWDTSQTHELMEIDQSANEEMSQSKSNSYISELATTSLDRSNDSSYPELAFNRVPQPSTLDQTELDESFNGGLPTLSSNQSFQPASIVPDFEDTPYQQVDKPLQSSLAQITTSCDTLPFVSRSPAISSSLFGTTATSPLTANHSESNTFFFPRAILSSPAEDNHEFDLNASEETNEFAVRLSSPVFGACSGQTTIERQSARMKNVKPPNEDVDDHEEQTNQNDFASRPETPQARLAVNQQNSQWEYEFGENESHTPLLNTVVDIHTDLTASRDVSYSDFAVSPSPRKSKCEFKERRLTKSPVNDLSTQELNSNDKNVVGEEANDELETEIESASQQPETKLKQKKKGKKSKSDKKLGKDNDETIAQDIVEKQKKKRKKMADKETDKGSQGLFGANNLAEMPFLEPKGRKKKTTTQQEEIPDENPINTIVMPLKKTKNLEITEANNKSGYKPFNRNQIPLIIRNYLTSHQWKKSAKMIMILTQDSRLYGDILLKTGLLIFDKKLHHRVDQRDEIIFELEQFNRLIQNIAGVSRVEATLEQVYLCFKYERFEYIDQIISNPIKYIKKHHSTEKKKVTGNNFKGFLEYYKYYRHMSYLANEEKDEQFPEEYCSSMSHISIIYGLRNIALRQAYPCDWYFLCLINMLVHYRKLEDAQDALQAYVEKHPFNINALFYLRKFNQLFLHSKSVDEQCTKNLISLDPGHPKILNWIDDLPDPVERVRVLLNFVDFIHNQHNHKAWRTLFALMNEMWPDKNQKKIICLAYEKYFSSYWPSYHFVLDSEPVKTAKCLYYKAKCALLLRPTKLMSFTEQVADALQTINPKLEEKLRLQITFIQETLQNLAKVDVDVEEPDESMNQKDLPDQPVAADWFNDSCEEIARDSQPMTEDTLITDQEVDKENLTTRVNITLASSGQTSIDISDDDIKDDVKDLEDKLQNELIDSSINSERNFDFVRSPLSGNESFDLSNHL